MLPTVQVGPLSLQVPGLLLLAGVWLGLTLSERRVRQRGEDPTHLYNLVIIALITGLLGARLAYAITYPSAFSANPWSLVSINPGLLDPFAGALIGIASAGIYLLRKHLSVWQVLDDLTPLLAVMGIAIGLLHLASGSGFGMATDLPFGIQLWGEVRHPSQVYETVAAILILIAILQISRTSWGEVPGNTFLTFIALSASSRLLLEAFRGDSLLVGNGLRAAQLIAWGILAICLSILAWRIYNLQDREASPQ